MLRLPERFATWFTARGWAPRPHQLAMLTAAAAGESVLLIAPTGGGKTLAGFLPSLVALRRTPRKTHPATRSMSVRSRRWPPTSPATSPPRSARWACPSALETRTGDTTSDARRRQPRQTARHAADHPRKPGAAAFPGTRGRPVRRPVHTIIIDEIHALAGTKRGDQLALCLARLATLAPTSRRVGLSATVAHRQPLLDYVAAGGPARLIEIPEGAPPQIAMMLPEARIAWSGRMGLASASAVLARIRAAGITIVFVNTRAQGELLFQELWKLNAETLPIALHHGSLDLAQRLRVRSGDVCWRIARGGGHLLARSGHRLGRRGPGHPGRRARRACRACCSASAVPTTAWTNPARPCSSRPTVSRCWSARPPSPASPRASWTAMRRGRAAWTCWRNICC